MYLKRIRARNFRAFGDGTTAPELDWELTQGLNILIGENDAGKTAIIDAIRHALWTTSYESIRLFDHDFHISDSKRADTLFIEAKLCGLNSEQRAAVIEWLTHEEDGTCSLIVHLHARRIPPHGGKRGRIDSISRAGRDGTGPEIGAAVRDLIRATYLRPLRDVEAELRPGRLSRLSQILGAHKLIEGQENNDFAATAPTVLPKNLVGLMAFTQHHLGTHEVIKEVEKDINNNYLSRFSFEGDSLASQIRIASDLSLTQILERFELALLPSGGVSPDERCFRGLGYNNALFMATELVLLRDGDELSLLLVEEPEAHLHPQLQERVMHLLSEHASSPEEGKRKVQVVISTHSPSLASGVDIECMTLVCQGQTYPLASKYTKLKKTDYSFLRRFIDATKANLFFARGVAIVEGPAEAILLPALAEACGRSFLKHGISVVNVGGVGLYHYARIFQRISGKAVMPIPVVCITDRDVVPDVAKSYIAAPAKGRRFESDFSGTDIQELIKRKKGRAEGDNTIVCVSDCWTLEYDLARYGCAELMYVAIQLGIEAENRGERLSEEQEREALKNASASWKTLNAAGHSAEYLASAIYQPLATGQASKAITAQYAAQLVASGDYGAGENLFNKLPHYLQQALDHLTGKKGSSALTPKAIPSHVTPSVHEKLEAAALVDTASDATA